MSARLSGPVEREIADLGARAARLEDAVHDTARRTVGLRILDRIGWTRMLRVAVGAFWLIYVGLVPTLFRPDLLHPADIGSDSSNYVAAGERLAAGHRIFGLDPGDRPVPLDNAPDWTVPILSPPTVAVTSVWVVALPDGIRLYPLWALGLAATIALGLAIAALAPPLLLVIAVEFMPGLAITAWSGNVNALIAPALAASWFGVRSRRPSIQALAGLVVAVATGVKIGPLLVAVWVLTQARRAASIGLLATGAALFGVTLLAAGWSSWLEYLDIARNAAAVPGTLSLPGVLERSGLAAGLAAASIPAMLVVVSMLIVVFRRYRLAFAIAVIGSVFATTVVRYETLGVGVAAMAPWFGRGLLVDRPATNRSERIARAGRGALVAGAALATLAIATSVASGGLTGSTVRVANETTTAVVARFRVPAQTASFGFVVPAKAAVTGWADIGGGSPPVVTIWSADCGFITQAPLPRSGGLIQVADAGVTVADVTVSGASPLADYVADCAPALKTRLQRR